MCACTDIHQYTYICAIADNIYMQMNINLYAYEHIFALTYTNNLKAGGVSRMCVCVRACVRVFVCVAGTIQA